ncbi:MAG: serine protease [Alphaproteobacteria bacterium]|nr:serine protease [Alphaproteobacteria bacterium]
MRPASCAALLSVLLAGGSAQSAPLLTFSTGTGFIIHRDGYVVTNHHVVQHCRKSIMLHGAVPDSAAVLVATDAEHDLALLKSESLPLGSAALSSDKQPLHEGDPVVVMGYPGQSWQTGEPETREAHILRTTGPRGDEEWVEFSDALRLGNSGGPLLDGAGNVVGVVAGKGKLVARDRDTGKEETVEAFDLAISLPVLRRFLTQYDIGYAQADSGLRHATRSIEQDARMFVVNVRCQVD